MQWMEAITYIPKGTTGEVTDQNIMEPIYSQIHLWQSKIKL